MLEMYRVIILSLSKFLTIATYLKKKKNKSATTNKFVHAHQETGNILLIPKRPELLLTESCHLGLTYDHVDDRSRKLRTPITHPKYNKSNNYIHALKKQLHTSPKKDARNDVRGPARDSVCDIVSSKLISSATKQPWHTFPYRRPSTAAVQL